MMILWSAFDVVLSMSNGWSLYQSRLEGNCKFKASITRNELNGIT
ncbi:hypothetical protein DOT37_21210 [Pantoea agglomerans]|nr:hypothetical protein DOT37_21210 [Pantoea agglomerans]TGX89209.1 hypothetical protein E5821_20060 [Pantoea agglomerans]